MPLLFILLLLHLCSSRFPSCSAATNTLSPSQSLTGEGKVVSANGKFALGFFQIGSEYFSHNFSSWYLGIWFNKIPKQTPVWVANRDRPTKDPSSSHLAISQDGNLIIFSSQANNLSIIWSSQVSIRTNNTIAVLLNNGNFVLRSSSNVCDILWQSFDHHTDALLPGAKLGLDKITGQKRNVVSRKNRINLASGVYSVEINVAGVCNWLWNSSVVYQSSGEWNGYYFNSFPEMSTAPVLFNFTFVNNDQEVFFKYTLLDESMPVYYMIDVLGQRKVIIWYETNKDWLATYPYPSDQCDVHAACGPFTTCNSNTLQPCSCMKGFSIESPDSWDLDDRTGGCKRNTPLDCSSNKSAVSLAADRFYAVPTNRLPYDPHNIRHVSSASECEQVCWSNCSCNAYSFGNAGSCSIWHGELLNVKQQHSDVGTGNGEILHLRLSAKEFQSRKKTKGVIIGGVIGACLAALAILLALVLRYRNKMCHHKIDGVNGLVPFRYSDLQRATNNFSEMIGRGGFGSVFKGLLNDSSVIAVKRLNGCFQAEKQFRAELSSIGIIHHTNLIKMIGFCCEGDKRLLVFEYMPNSSLDTHLFGSNNSLNWGTRYNIALGVAKGLAYLHESCRDCIIHCDIKPQNILLDESFVPKVADFGMAKLLGRNSSRVMTTTRGTIGYLAPEWIRGMPITSKVDVYGYGMILLEIISGRRNSRRESYDCSDHTFYFPVEVAHKLLLEGDVLSLVDDKLYGDVIVKEVERACKVACWCIQDNEFDRPTMEKVVQILEGLVELDSPPMPRHLQAIVQS